MKILGISAFYHDSAAAIIENGVVTAAMEEERFTRVKHAYQFPHEAIQACLRVRHLTIDDIDAVAHYEKPLLRFERVLDNFVKTYPFSLKPFVKGIPEWVDQKIKVESIIRKKLKFRGDIYYVPHHVSHASASYFPSGFFKAAILTIDGIGEYQTTGLWKGEGGKITSLGSIEFPHSIGLFYSTFTAFLGFRINEDEYKVMGLGAYGKPSYLKQIHELVDVKDDGSFKLDLSYFAFREAMKMWTNKFEEVFGKPRLLNEPITTRHKDIAASCQAMTEIIYFKMLRHLHDITGYDDVCLGGGVALNALANGKIYNETPFKRVYIIGPAGDGGSAIGAPLFVYHHAYRHNKQTKISSLSLGTEYEDFEIEKVLQEKKLAFKKYNSQSELISFAAKLLAKDKIIGWFEGRMEYGPRALGNRSILANPKRRAMKDKVNKIKVRELFRPFAGAILRDHIHEYFEVPEKKHWSPFMLFCFKVRAEKRDRLAAIVHEDFTCRVQTVDENDGLYYRLIKNFYKLTGIPCVLNTSFNLKGEPIVETPEQAVNDFLKTELDYLVISSYVVEKRSSARKSRVRK